MKRVEKKLGLPYFNIPKNTAAAMDISARYWDRLIKLERNVCFVKLIYNIKGKTINDEQTLRYELAMFKNWFSHKSTSITCNFQDLALTRMNTIFTQLIFDWQSLGIIYTSIISINILDEFAYE